ncbi:hypothetical protein JQC92_07195 [Shewanella sp. 202IG2-18]|uniref:hypothetical protein n=1 Tax=Parashewanella hymeniacidonis TaxID=2807618 RepID=UPI0019621F89|nr:hypothetical protein [Parashewanella hymeniacidonis]MBM7071827.1 hypothetical protein [Parashewanella hymeniacidonis]
MSLTLTLVANESGQWTLHDIDELKQIFITLENGKELQVTVIKKNKEIDEQQTSTFISKDDQMASTAFAEFWQNVAALKLESEQKNEIGAILSKFTSNPYYEKADSASNFVEFSLYPSAQQRETSTAAQYVLQSIQTPIVVGSVLQGEAVQDSSSSSATSNDATLRFTSTIQKQNNELSNTEVEPKAQGLNEMYESVDDSNTSSFAAPEEEGSLPLNIFQLAKQIRQGYTLSTDEEGSYDEEGVTGDSNRSPVIKSALPISVSPSETISSIDESYTSRFSSRPVLSVPEVVNNFESYGLGEEPILFLDMDEVFLTDVTQHYTKDMEEKEFSLVKMKNPEELKTSIDKFMARYPKGKVVVLTNSTEAITDQELTAVKIKKEWFYAVLTKNNDNFFDTKGERADGFLNSEALAGRIYSGACLADDTKRNREEFEASMIERDMKVKVVPVVGAVNEKLHIVALQEVKAGKYANVQDAEEAIKEQPEFVAAFKAYNTSIAELE